MPNPKGRISDEVSARIKRAHSQVSTLMHLRKGVIRGSKLIAGNLKRVKYVYSTKGGKRVRKGVIAEQKSPLTGFGFAYFPSPEEAKLFAEASQAVFKDGPADVYPGAVGVLRYGFTLNQKKPDSKPNQITIRTIQGAFLQKEGGLSRSLVTKHGGWRQHLLNVFFEKAQKERYASVIPPRRMSKETRKIFFEIAEQHGYRSTNQMVVLSK
jgi:hypothetical protein